MNLQPIMAFTQGKLFRDLQDFVRDGIVDRIDEIVYRSECIPQIDPLHTLHIDDRSLAAIPAGCQGICRPGRRGSEVWKPPQLLQSLSQHDCRDDRDFASGTGEHSFSPLSNSVAIIA